LHGLESPLVFFVDSGEFIVEGGEVGVGEVKGWGNGRVVVQRREWDLGERRLKV
jgi:hypothetical protein